MVGNFEASLTDAVGSKMVVPSSGDPQGNHALTAGVGDSDRASHTAPTMLHASALNRFEGLIHSSSLDIFGARDPAKTMDAEL